MTTRLTPRAIKPRGEFMLGCREVELIAMGPADAVEFFHKQEIKGTHTEIEAACEPYGYHPLSLRLLAGQILKDFYHPGDIIAAKSLKIDGNIIQQKHHVLEVSYNSLPPHEQKLLSTIACFRSPVELKTLQSIVENKNSLDDDLHDLIERGLLHFDEKNKKFDLHPIVRRYAYERMTTFHRVAMHRRLRDYFATVDTPIEPQTIDDLAPVIELVCHTIMAKELDEAQEIIYYRLADVLDFQFGADQIYLELLRSLLTDGDVITPPRLKEEGDQGWVLNSLANSYSKTGQPRFALSVFELALQFVDKLVNKKNKASAWRNIAFMAYLPIGMLAHSEHSLCRSIELNHNIEDEIGEGIAHGEFGHVLSYRGIWHDAEQELDYGITILQKISAVHLEGGLHADCAWRFILMTRADPQSSVINLKSAIKAASGALELADETTKRKFSHPRQYIRAHWLLGAAYRANNELTLAEENLPKALNLCRQINMVDHEGVILLDLARLHHDQKNHEEARSLADEALLITERCGYVLQGADVNLFLAQYALEQEKDKAKAKSYAEEALKLATCDGPPYYYKVAYEEAERMLERLKDENKSSKPTRLL